MYQSTRRYTEAVLGGEGKGGGFWDVVLNLITVITMHDSYSFFKMMKC